jgi:hypothetical protein
MTLLEGADAQTVNGCDHGDLHSPAAFYSPTNAEIRYVVVCDSCGTETREVHREAYVPNFDPSGNDPYIAAPA